MKGTFTIYFTNLLMGLLLFSAFSVFAQSEKERDSLWQVYQSVAPDTTKVKALLDLGYTYLRTNPDSAELLSRLALQMAEDAGHLKGTADAYSDLGLIEWAKGNYPEAIKQLSEAFALYNSLGYRPGMAKCLNNTGYMYYETGAYQKALENHLAYLEMMQEDGDQKRAAGALHNIGMVHQAKGDYIEAMDYYLQSVTVKKELKDSSRLANSLEALGDIYYELKDYARAQSFYQQGFNIRKVEDNTLGMVVSLYNIGRNHRALEQYEEGLTIFKQGRHLAEELENDVLVAYHLEGMGSIYKETGQFEQALNNYKQSLELRDQSADRKGRSLLLNEIADLYIQLGEWEKAFASANEAYAIAADLEIKEELKDASFHLARIYSKRGDYQKAHQFLFQVNELKDSLFNAEKSLELAKLQVDHAIKEKENEKQKAMQDLELQNQRAFITGLVIALVLIFSLTAFLLIAYQNNRVINKKLRSNNLQLQQQKHDLEKLNTDLKSANQKVQQFAFAASHDLKESIRSVTSFGQLLERKVNGGEPINRTWKTYLGYISTSGKRMEKMLVDLLNFLNLGGNYGALEVVDLNEVLENLKILLQQELQNVNAHLEVNQLPVIVAHPILIEQLFYNLLDNAIQFRRTGKPLLIEVGQKMEDNTPVFYVKDNGIGIEEPYLDYIFEPFKRLHDRNLSGSGLGLSICRNIVKRYKGTITVKSKLGRGSTFYFTLPRAKFVSQRPAMEAEVVDY